ncbi:hypothetical protein J4420_03735 [Candidatus Woesearchaeota archaeon]|nr:hypothetical protein [Candidatus Woesearchaeota archaeon]
MVRTEIVEAHHLEEKIAKESAAYHTFKSLEHWQPLTKIITPEELLLSSHYVYGLFDYLYQKTRTLYEHLPLRRNGERPFIHPLNVAWGLQKAGVQDGLTYCVALLHDFVEEIVDSYKDEKNVPEDNTGIALLDKYEETVFSNLEGDLSRYCQQNGMEQSYGEKIVATVRLLTRHKRHFYYQSISQIFDCQHEELREKAIAVKLADRSHNILSIEKFSEEVRIYECFKNLFILNNVKEYLLTKNWSEKSELLPIEKLFKKCAKATYDAFLTTGHLSRAKGIAPVTPLIQLALKKYEFERSGFSCVTEMEEDETHPVRLFQGIIRKYDACLHDEYDTFLDKTEEERKYCRNFFYDFNLTPEQVQAVIDYKDAYALKEVVACLLYQPKYVLQLFLCSALTKEGRIE